MSKKRNSYNPETGYYSYKKDGQWFFSVCPPDQVASKKVDGKWYWIEMCVGSGGDGSGVNLAPYAKTVDVDAKDEATLESARDYTDQQIAEIEIVIPDGYATEDWVTQQIEAIEIPDPDGYATKEWVTQQIEAIELPEGGEAFDGDMKGGTIENLGNAVHNTDAVNKQVCQGWDTYTLESANDYCDKEIKKIDIPSISGLATQEYVDGADQAVQRFATTADDAVMQWVGRQNYLVDVGQNAQIETLENKVTALEGSVVEAQYRSDPRDNPSAGGFVLQDDAGSKALYFSQAKKIEFWKSDYVNKPIDSSTIMAGDIIRMVMSPLNYGNYTVTSVEQKENSFVLGVTFGSCGEEEIVFDGSIYDFTHTTPFDVGNAATKTYVDAQDGVTLDAAKAYADSLDIPEAVETDEFALRNTPMHNDTLIWYNSDQYAGEKMRFSDKSATFPQRQENKLFYGNYKSNGGELMHWQFGYSDNGNYWDYDWVMGSNLAMNWVMNDNKVLSVDKTGVDMPTAYIVGDYSLDGVAEDQVETVKAKAREIDIGHRLRELKRILMELKVGLLAKSSDTETLLLEVLKNVEDI